MDTPKEILNLHRHSEQVWSQHRRRQTTTATRATKAKSLAKDKITGVGGRMSTTSSVSSVVKEVILPTIVQILQSLVEEAASNEVQVAGRSSHERTCYVLCHDESSVFSLHTVFVYFGNILVLLLLDL